MVALTDVCFGYRNSKFELLSSVQLTVKPGERVGIVGPNGCGKSTLTKLLLGIIRPDNGEILLFGHKASWRNHLPRVGYIGDPGHNTEELGLPAKVRVGQLIDVLSSTHVGNQPIFSLEEILECLELDILLDRPIERLSTGERKKLMACMTFLKNPDLIILDEPFDGLDWSVCEEVKRLVQQYTLQTHVSSILISHSQIDIDSFSDTVYVLELQKLHNLERPSYRGDVTVDGDRLSIQGRSGVILGHLSDVLAPTKTMNSLNLSLHVED